MTATISADTMSTATTDTTALDHLRELAETLPGRVTVPGDAAWDEAHLAWARAIGQEPIAVVEVASPDHVVAAVRFAAAHGFAVSAQPVGHGATEAITGTILLRTRGLDELHIDVERRVARVGAGVKWGELLAAAAPHNLIGLAGSSADPTVAGFTLGGGLSWFGRAHGLAAHSVLAFDVVDARGVHRRVTAESDPDLFWALRGGGGDFAIVTALEIELFPAPHLYGGRIMWPIEMARPVLRAFRDITAAAPEELTLWTHLLRFPPLPQLPEFLRGKSFVSVEATYLGSASEAEALLAPLREIPAVHLDTMGPVDIAALGDICAEPTDPTPSQEMSSLLNDLDDDTIDALLEVVGYRVQSPLVTVQIRAVGGALARGTVEQGPTGAVHEPYNLLAMGIPMTPELGAAISVALAGLQGALAESMSDRAFFTFLCADPNPARAFAPAQLDRLRAVKHDVDPGGVVRSNRPVG